MTIDIEIGRSRENFVIRYTPKGTPVRAPRPVVLSNLNGDRLYDALKGLKELYGDINLTPTRNQGSEELTSQMLDDIIRRI